MSCIFIALGGVLSLPVYMRIPEKRKDDTLEKSSTWELIKEIFSTDASRIIVLKNLFDGGTGGAVAIFSYYSVRRKGHSGRTIRICDCDLDRGTFRVCVDRICDEELFDLKDKETVDSIPYATNDRSGRDTVSCHRICDRTQHLKKRNRVCDLDCDQSGSTGNYGLLGSTFRDTRH